MRAAIRAANDARDLPTHGGRTLAYVYEADSRANGYDEVHLGQIGVLPSARGRGLASAVMTNMNLLSSTFPTVGLTGDLPPAPSSFEESRRIHPEGTHALRVRGA